MENNKHVIDEIKEYCLQKPGVYESRPFGEYPICYRVMGKIFAQLNPQEDFYKITLKCEPEKADFYRQAYQKVVVRGYHCPPVQQPYWNTIDLYAFDDIDMLFQMIDEAYDTLIGKFSKKLRLQLPVLADLEFRDSDGTNEDFLILCDKLDQVLIEKEGKELKEEYEKYNKTDNLHDVIVVYQKGIPVACGGFQMYDEEHAELKRVFTDSLVQNIGVGAELIRRLEAKAKIKGYRFCILETGTQLLVAHHLYKRAGYKIIPNYGQYAGMPDSVCMEKKI